MRKFIGRREELRFLNERYASEHGELVVLYGRRRIGKTELLLEFCKNRPHMFYVCEECTNLKQLNGISKAIGETVGGNIGKSLSLYDWASVFSFVTEIPAGDGGKRLMVIDEFPLAVKNNKGMMSQLQNLWDHSLKDRNVMIVLCGSSMSFIENEILGDKNPIYGRTTGIMKLGQLSFEDSWGFFPKKDAREMSMIYSVLGGVPHYLSQFDPDASLKENVVRRILTKGSPLYSEVEFLLRQELREVSTYNTIISAVALGNTKLNNIHTKTGVESPKVATYLLNLMDIGIIVKEFPLDVSGGKTSGMYNGLYRISDNFFRFWYLFIFPNRTELEKGRQEDIYELDVEPSLKMCALHTFEDICMEYLRRCNSQGKLPFRFLRIGRWWSKTSEIDILAVDKGERNCIVGECKYKESKVGLKEYRELLAKRPPYRDARMFLYLFSKSGFDEDVIDLSKNDGVSLISLQDMFSRANGDCHFQPVE